MKRDSEYLEFFWPMRHYLITCGQTDKKSNIITISFCMPVSKVPPMVAFAIGKKAYSLGLIKESGEFVVNFPLNDIRKQAYYCGYHSGSQVDKFKETGLTALPARKIKAPVIKECPAQLECIVRNIVESGDKFLVIGEVIEAYADEELISGKLKPEFACGEFPMKVYGNRFGI